MFISNPVTPASIGAVPTSRQIIAGTQMTGGGDLSANRTLNNAITYVEASFPTAPEIQFGGASVDVTYSAQIGSYVRIGDVVFYEVEITLTSKGSSTGQAKLVNWPIAAAAAPRSNASALFLNMNSTETLFAQIDAEATTVTLFTVAAGTAAVADNTSFNNNSVIQLTGFYFVQG